MRGPGLFPGIRRPAWTRWIVFTAWAVASFAAFLRAQEAGTAPLKPTGEDPPAKPTDTAEGLWPSPRLMKLMLTRWAEEAGRQYDLDEDQRAQVREATVDRWSKFLDDHRDELQPLANEFIEMRMELEPPPKEKVQDWARRAAPILEKVRGQIEEGTEELRQVIRPAQRVKFEADALRMKIGLQFADRKIQQWQSGEFERDEFWEPPSGDRAARRAERRRRREAAEARRQEEMAAGDQGAEPADQIAIELDSWDAFVTNFIRLYALDEGQRTTVLSCLSELKERAISHRDRHREEIDKLEERVASNSGGEAELAEIGRQLAALYGPIDDMFKELRQRIEQIPTVQQRESAAKQQAETPAPPNAEGRGQDAIRGAKPPARDEAAEEPDTPDHVDPPKPDGD